MPGPRRREANLSRMRIDEILATRTPVFSVEFFPPKTEEATEQLLETARSLRELEPDFVSVTYGAGGSTREGTVEITRALKDELGLETMAHLSCVGETTRGPRRRPSTGSPRRGSRTSSRCAATRRAGEADFVQPEGGLGSAAELAAFIGEGYDFTIGGACFPEVHPEAPDLDTDLALPEDQGRLRRPLPDHPALLRQPGLLRLRRRGARARDRRADPRRGDPGRQLRPDEADLRALRRDASRARLEAAMLGGRRRPAGASSSSASPTPPSSARSC